MVNQMTAEIQIRKKLGSFRLDVCFQAHTSRVGILGASGCGKSMTLKCIAGIEKPDEGMLLRNGYARHQAAPVKKVQQLPGVS